MRNTWEQVWNITGPVADGKTVGAVTDDADPPATARPGSLQE